MDRWFVAVIVATVLAVLAGSFLVPPAYLGTHPWVLAAAAVLGVGQGVVVVWLSRRTEAPVSPDLVRWVALPYAFALAAVVIGLAIPAFGTVLGLGLAFSAGILTPVFVPGAVARPSHRRRE